MPKTYNTFTNVATGDVLTATNFNNVLTNIAGYRVPPLVRVRRNAAQNVATATNIAVNYDAEDVDTDGTFTATSNVVTIQTAGVYLVTATLAFSANSTGHRAISIWANPTYSGSGDTATITAGTRIAGNYAMAVTTAATQTVVTCSSIYSFAISDTIGVVGSQNSGSTLTFVNAVEQNTLSVAWLGQLS